MRIAAALTLLDNPTAEEIGQVTMDNAIRLGRAYTSHALAAFATIHAADDRLGHAREVLGWLRKNHQPVVALREVYRALRGRTWVESADNVRATLGVLTERGHVRPLAEQREPGKAGRPSESYQLHPNHLKDDPAPPEHPEPERKRSPTVPGEQATDGATGVPLFPPYVSVNGKHDEIRYEGGPGAGEQTRAEVKEYASTLRDVVNAYEKIIRLGLEERWAKSARVEPSPSSSPTTTE